MYMTVYLGDEYTMGVATHTDVICSSHSVTVIPERSNYVE